MQQNDDKIDTGTASGVSVKTKRANLIIALILGAFVLFGMTSTFFMLSDKI